MKRQLFYIIIAAALAACAVQPPTPFPAGKPTIEPPGCEDLRKRGGEC